MGILYVPFAVMVIVGASNAVNLTDGLDGLAIVPVMIVAGCFALIAYLAGNYNFATYLQINYVPGTGDLAVMCGALIGAGLGFCGLTPHQPAYLWAIQGRWHWAAVWAPFRLQHAMNWYWRLLAVLLSRPFW